MAMLQVVGMFRPPSASVGWASGKISFLVSEAWSDGVNRIAGRIDGVYNAIANEWRGLNGVDLLYVPGADVGSSAEPPFVTVTYELTDTAGKKYSHLDLGAPWIFQIKATAAGAWNFYSPHTPLVVVSNPAPLPPTALTSADIGVTVAGLPITPTNTTATFSQSLIRGGTRAIPRVGEAGGHPVPGLTSFAITANLSGITLVVGAALQLSVDADTVKRRYALTVSGSSGTGLQNRILPTPPVGWSFREINYTFIRNNPIADAEYVTNSTGSNPYEMSLEQSAGNTFFINAFVTLQKD